MAEKCLICEGEVESDLCKVGNKGIIGIVNASVLRKDGKDKGFRNKTIGVVHNACRREYVRSDSIKRFLREQALSEQPSTSRNSSSLRSGQRKFDFKTKCFFCTETYDEERERKKPYTKRRIIVKVRTATFHNSVLARGQERKDEWGNDVVRRICTVGDLHAVDAIYHMDCYKKFTLATLPSKRKAGRPIDEGVSEAMNEIFDFIEGNDNCQFSMDDLLGQVTGEPPTVITIKDRMKEKYGDQIVFSTIRARQTVVCFRATGEKILNDAWYTSRCIDEQTERARIVQKAAEIILEDIESMAYDNSAYPPLASFCREAEELIPEFLQVFTCLAKKKRSQEAVKKKMTTIAHALISAVRPRCFISPILSSIALLIYRKYGSKNLVDLLSKLGLSASYYDSQQLELSTIYHTEDPIPIGTFIQYIFDNADFNVSTLDGWNTFHSMGGIKCVTPANAILPSTNVKRLKSAPPQEEVSQLGVLELQTFEGRGTNALQQIIVEDLSVLKPIPSDIFTPTLQDLLWMSGKWLHEVKPTPEVPTIPEWKGFMQMVSKLINKESTSVTFLPFINSPPNEYSTIRTALQYALKNSQELGSTVCFVTFDQPLYLKAREITFGNIAVRLGGFHTLMSFMGCIGHTMAGSGLKDVLCQVFAPNSVDKMLTGHAYSRAVRGHLLVQLVLGRIVLEGANISEEEKMNILTMLTNMEELTLDKVEGSAPLSSTLTKFQNNLETLKENGPTAALWVQYFNMVTLMKKFIDAERCGDWDGHLACVQQMIPFFHASGHFQYAKCAHLYVQDMIQLKNSHPQAYKEFAEKGYFTINRTGTPWAGVWSDMVIEQTLMRSMKSSGGLTRGRGITDSVLAKWVCGSPGSTAAICTSLEEFAGVVFESGEQHVDFRLSRQQRDSRDRAKIGEWFNDHPPFPKLVSLMSLSTGILGNSKVNCHQALDIGTKTMQSFIGSKFGEIKQSKKNVVLSLASMSSSIKINGETVTINPLTIFQRTVIAKKNEEDVAELLTYELTPYPLALFLEGGMRKGKKSALYDVLPVENNAPLDLNQSANVVDGGFLLHRMKWKPSSKMSSICCQYIAYVRKQYGLNCMVVFDGYSDVNSTKRAEQKRRNLTKTSVDINCNESTIITVQQEHFLANEKNKTRLIQFLTEKMTAEGIETTVATGDADGTIVRSGLDKAAVHPTVTIIGEDVDLIVLLIGLAPPDTNVFFMKPGRGKVDTKLFSVQRLQQLPFAKTILLLHSFSGCDTTSAIHGKSKVGIAKLFTAKPDVIEKMLDIFTETSIVPEDIEQAGEKLFLAIYQAPAMEQNLNKHRYSAFLRASTKPKFDMATLPPTRGASKQHSFRVYLQIQQWLGNPLPPTQWGWARGEDGILKPVTTNDPVAPDSILNTIFCRCATGCGVRCGCRKAGIACSSVCGVCSGSCTNGAPIEETIDDDDILDLEDN